MTVCKPIRILIAEDERHARDKLKHFLHKLEDNDLQIREAEDGRQALEEALSWCPHILIVDIHMPHLSGLEVIHQLSESERPLIVFTTAYEEYALKAFEIDAVDYLLKPFSFDRFSVTVDRVMERLHFLQGLLDPNVEPTGLVTPREEPRREPYLTRISVEGPGRIKLFLSLNEVYLIKSAGNYCEFFTSEASYLRRGTLKNITSRLSSDAFLRLNRSEVVQISHIKGIEVMAHGDALVNLYNGAQLKWSRHYRAENGGLFEI